MPLMNSHNKCTIPPVFLPKKLNLNLSKALVLTSGVREIQVTRENHGTQMTPQEAKSQTQSKEHSGSHLIHPLEEISGIKSKREIRLP